MRIEGSGANREVWEGPGIHVLQLGSWSIFDPPEPSKSSIFIQRVVIFEISTFSVRMPSSLLLGSLLASILVPFQASWGSLGAVFRAHKR